MLKSDAKIRYFYKIQSKNKAKFNKIQSKKSPKSHKIQSKNWDNQSVCVNFCGWGNNLNEVALSS